MKYPCTLTSADEALLRRTLTSGLSDDEHAVFVRTCNRSGLDPFARQIYICRDGAELRFLATIDGFRVAAERTGKYAGQLGPHWCGPDGKWLTIWTAKEPPTAARIGVLRSDFKAPVWGKAIYSEFSQGGDFWQGMPCNQLAKCAEALAFRKAFPKVFSGLYTSEEFSSARRSRLSSVAPANAEQGNVIVLPVPDAPASRPSRVPLPLQPFVEKGLQDKQNVSLAWRFIQSELEAQLGEAGRQIFNTAYFGMPKLFKSREAAEQAIAERWCELWGYVERAKGEAA